MGLASPMMRLASTAERPRGSASFADRKSTRLNSSHLGISYAVFRLKQSQAKRFQSPTPCGRRRTLSFVAGGGSAETANRGAAQGQRLAARCEQQKVESVLFFKCGGAHRDPPPSPQGRSSA